MQPPTVPQYCCSQAGNPEFTKPVLQLGMGGAEVVELQKLLAHWSAYTSHFDGCFDPSLEDAVKAFQYRMFLPTTGVVDSPTWYSLYAGAPIQMPRLQVGSRGDAVGQLQTALTQLGDYRGLIDGEFGAATQTAVLAFQSRQGMVADGMVGPCTWRVLSKAISCKTADRRPLTPPIPPLPEAT